MYCCLLSRRPIAFKKWKPDSPIGQAYRRDIQDAFSARYSTIPGLAGDLYGIIYCFYRAYNKHTDADADNISKPVWDCLGGNFLYEDDRQIKLRLAGCYDLASNPFADLDVTKLPGDILTELLSTLEQEPYVIYIECGTLKKDMLRFNLE